jgi:BCD family chlorophyll transporter-like MFS transporter
MTLFIKRIQLGLIHTAAAMTLAPINSTLNRVMIKEMALAATLVALLASLPYLFSPIQVMIGSFADRHPLFGLRRTPYIAFGLGLCALGVTLAPQAAFILSNNLWAGLPFAALVFGLWGMGYNFASVSYFSLASEVSGEHGRSRTVAVMFFMMIIGIIVTAIGLSRLLTPYSDERLVSAFREVALLALILAGLGLVGLERRSAGPAQSEARYSLRQVLPALTDNPQVARFFVYLILLLAAILGQDILLEPFAGEAFNLPVQATTRITSIWGVCVLLSLLAAGFLEGRIPKRRVAQTGAGGAALGFLLIALSGFAHSLPLFYSGVVLLGLGTGLATVSNLSLMLDMTVAGRVGLFMGAWGMADALARLTGSLVGGAVRDLATGVFRQPVAGYALVFLLEAGMLVVSLLILRRVDVGRFRRTAAEPSVVERAALAGEA